MLKYRHYDEIIEAAEVLDLRQCQIDMVTLVTDGDCYHFNIAWSHKNNPEKGGYIVKHENGISFMNKASFEGLYKKHELS